MGKGPKRRKGADDEKFDAGHDKIDMSKKSKDHVEREPKKERKGGKRFGPY